MIDHSCFPHIVDLIFELASTSSLFVMSHVCSEWRQLAHAKFEHVHDLAIHFDFSSNFQITHVYTFRLGVAGPSFRIPTSEATRLPLLSGCRIVDISRTDSHVMSGSVVPNAHTARYRTEVPSKMLLPVRRLVLQDSTTRYLPPDVRRLVYLDTGTTGTRFEAPQECSPYLEISYVYLGDKAALKVNDVWRLSGLFTWSESAGLSLTCVNLSSYFVRLVAQILAPLLGAMPPFQCQTLCEYRQSIGEKEFAIETDWTSTLSS